MNRKILLRLISLIMLAAAVVFVIFALAHPELGTAFSLGNIRIGATVWRIGYAVYIIGVVGLFTASFFVKNGKSNR